MKYVLLDGLDAERRRCLLNFALTCGVDKFTVSEVHDDTAERLEPLSIAHMLVQDVYKDRPHSSKHRVWTVQEACLDSVCAEMERELRDSGSRWTFFRFTSVFATFGPEGSWMYLQEHQGHHLFRLGFNFRMEFPEGKVFKDRISAEDLPENNTRRVRALRRNRPKTIAEVIADPYSLRSFPPSYGARRRRPDIKVLENERIAQWWLPEHDEILRLQIQKDGWRWWPSAPDLIAVMDYEAFEAWKRDDPNCVGSSWQYLLTEFARARADSLGLTSNMNWPDDAQDCSICNEHYTPSVHHPNMRQKASVLLDHLCQSCVMDSYDRGNLLATREDILVYIQELASALGRIPPSGFGKSHVHYRLLSEKNFIQVIRLLHTKPDEERVLHVCGSWFQALLDAGVLDGDSRRLSRGTQCFATDGHLCLSLAEKVIDDTLSELGIPHQREVRYPDTRFRCDFLVGSTYVEYFGLRGNPDYDARIAEKKVLCERLNLSLLALYPEDIASDELLQGKLTGLRPNPIV